MADIVCMQCKYIGKPKRVKRGSKQLEMMGWMLFPLGLPYTLWRMLAKKPVCQQCESEFIVAANSIAGQRLIRIASGGPLLQAPASPMIKPLPDHSVVTHTQASPKHQSNENKKPVFIAQKNPEDTASMQAEKKPTNRHDPNVW